MTPSNAKKTVQLGMNHGTASSQLRKAILWDYVVKCEHNVCFQCKGQILSIDELSIEHKEPWLDSENPKELFFSLDNIAFSHISCNIGAARKTNKVYKDYAEYKTAENKRLWANKSIEERKLSRRARYEKYGN